MAKASGKSTAELKDELAKLLSLTAGNLLRLAVIVHELESRGEDLSGIKLGLLPILRKIASGQLLPEIVVMFAGEPTAISRIAKMPIEEQSKFANGSQQYERIKAQARSWPTGWTE